MNNTVSGYIPYEIERQISRLRGVEQKDDQAVIDVIRTLTLGYVKARKVEKVGITMHYNPGFRFLTEDSITKVAQKAIDNIEVVLSTRKTNSGRTFKDSRFHKREFYENVKLATAGIKNVRTLRDSKNIQKELLKVMLEALALDYGIFEFTQEHPVRSLINKSIAIVVSMDHYHRAHTLTKKYGFTSCNVMMSFALTEYYEKLLKERGG